MAECPKCGTDFVAEGKIARCPECRTSFANTPAKPKKKAKAAKPDGKGDGKADGKPSAKPKPAPKPDPESDELYGFSAEDDLAELRRVREEKEETAKEEKKADAKPVIEVKRKNI